MQFLRQLDNPSPILIPLSLSSLLLLPFSLSANRFPALAQYAKYHTYIVLLQLLIFVIATNILVSRRSGGGLPILDIVRWALPQLIAGGVEMQRRGEKEGEVRIRELEGLRYDVRGA
jgi:hypothetical protein